MRSQKSGHSRKSRHIKGFRRFTTFERGLCRAPLSLVPGRYDSLLSFERLEERSLLAASPLVVDLSGDTQPDTIVVELDTGGTNVQVTVNGNLVQNVPLANVTDLSVFGSAYGNALNVDLTNGNLLLSRQLDFKGAAAGVESNSLSLLGGSFLKETYAPISQNSGDILLLDSLSEISFQNVAFVQDSTQVESLNVFGTAGDDTISYSQLGKIANTNFGRLEVNNFVPMLFANKTGLEIDGGSGTDGIDLDPSFAPTGLTSIAVDGNATSNDTLTVNGSGGADNITVHPTDARTAGITGAGPVPINASNINHLIVNGQGGNVALNYENSGASTVLTFTPGASANSATIDGRYADASGGGLLLPVSYTDIALGGSLTFSHVPSEGQSLPHDALTVEGTAKNDTFSAGSEGVALYQSDTTTQTLEALPIFTPAIASLTLAGLAGDDTFNLFGSPAALPFSTFIDGSGATDPPTVILDSDGTPTTANLGAGQFIATTATVTGGGLGTVTVSGVGVVNVNDGGASQTGTGGITVTGQPVTPENFVVTPVANGAEIQNMNPNPVFSLSPTLNYGGAGAVTIIGDGPPSDGDMLTINSDGVIGHGGTPITVTNTQVLASGDTPINYTAANFVGLHILGLQNSNHLIVDGMNGFIAVPIQFDGGAPGDNLVTVQGVTAHNAFYQPGPSQGQGSLQLNFVQGTENVSFSNALELDDYLPSQDLTVEGTTGSNRIRYVGDGSSNDTPIVYVNDLTPIAFSQQSSLEIHGNGTYNNISLDTSVTPAGLTAIFLDDNPGPTALTVNGGANQNINYAPTDAHTATITGAGAGAVPIHGFGLSQVTIDGDQSADNLTYMSPAVAGNQLTFVPGATVNAGQINGVSSGSPLLPLNYINFAASGSLTFANASEGRSDFLTFDGTAGNDAFFMDSSGVQLDSAVSPFNPTSLVAFTPGVSNLTLAGLAGDDTFNILGGLPFTQTVVDGSGATDPPTVNLTSDGTPTTANLGAGQFGATVATVTGGGLGTVTIGGVGVVNVNDGANATGTGGMTVTGQTTTPENFVVTPVAIGAEIQDFNPDPVFALSPIVNYVGAGAVTIAADGPPVDGDTLTVDAVGGPQGQKTTTVTNTQVLVTDFTPVDYTAADLAGLIIKGLGSANYLSVDNTAGPVTIPLLFDGGASNLGNLNLLGRADSDLYKPGPDPGQGEEQINFGGVFERISYTNVSSVTDLVTAGQLTVQATTGDDSIAFNGFGGDGGGDGEISVNNLTPAGFEFGNKLSLEIDSLSGNNVIRLDTTNAVTGLTAISINTSLPAPSTSNTTVVINGGANQNINYAPTDGHSATITGAGAVLITLNSVDQVTIDGDQSADNLTITTPVGPVNANAITFTPGDTSASASVSLQESGGVALLPVNYMNFARYGSVSFTHAGGGRTDQLDIIGSAVSDVFQVPPFGTDEVELDNVSGGTPVAATLDINTAGISDLTLDGSSGEAVFNVATSLPYHSITLIGNGDKDPAVANLTGNGSPVTWNVGGTTPTVSGGGLNSAITFSGVANVVFDNHGGATTVVGSIAGDNNLTVSPTGPQSAFVQNGAGPVVSLSDTPSLTVSLPGSDNTLSVNGSGGDDVITATSGSVTVNANLPISYTASDLASLDVNGLDGINTLFVDAKNGPVTTPMYYDGGNALNNSVVLQGSTAYFASYEPTIDAGTRAVTVNYATGIEHLYSKNIDQIHDNVPSGGLYLYDYAAASTVKYATYANVGGLIQADNDPGIFFENQALVDIELSGEGTVDLDNSSVVPAGLHNIFVQGEVSSGALNVALNILAPAGSNINYQPTSGTSATISGAGVVPITATAIARVSIDGGGGNDTFTYTTLGAAPSVIRFTPGVTVDSGSIDGRFSILGSGSGGLLLPVAYTNIDRDGSLVFAHAGGQALDQLTIEGTPGDDTFALGGGEIVMTQSSVSAALEALTTFTPGVADLVIDGAGGNDTFNLTAPLPAANVNLVASSASNSAIANVTGDGTAVNVQLGTAPATITGGGLGFIALSGIAAANLNASGGAVTTVGAAGGNNTLAVIPTGPQTVTVQDNGTGPVVNVTGVNTSGLIVSLPGSGNTLSINGAAGDDTITATSGTVTVNANLPISYTATNLASLDVNGLDGTNTLVVDATNGPVTTPVYYDGGNALNNGVVLEGSTASSASYEPTIDAGTRAVTVNYTTASEHVYTKNIDQIQDNVPAPDGLYLFDYAAASTVKYATYNRGGLIQADNDPGLFFENQAFVDIELSGEGTVDLDNSSVVPLGLHNIFVQGEVSSGALNVALDVLAPAGSNINYQPTSSGNATISGAGVVPITATSVARVNIDGGGGSTNLTVTTPVGPANINAITFTPGDTAASGAVSIREGSGVALLPVSYTNFARSGSVNFVHAGGGRTDQLYISGSTVNDVFQLPPFTAEQVELDTLSGGGLAAATLDIGTTGILDLTLDGSAGQATFNVAAPLPYHSVTLIGNGSADPAVANLTGNGSSAAVTLNATSQNVTGGGLGSVVLNGVASVNLANGAGDITLANTSVNDNLAVSPNGANTATARVGTVGPAVNTNNTGRLYVDNATTTVVVQGTQKANEFTIDEVGRTVGLQSAGTNLKPLALNPDVSDVRVGGGPANDTFQVIPARNTTGNDVVGSATFQVPSNLLVQVDGTSGANDALLVAGPGGATLSGGSYGAAGLFAVIDRTSSTQGTVRLFQQSDGAEPIQYPDISYNNVERVQANTPGAGGFAAQTLVLGPDPYDPNGSPATAAYLGSAAAINATNLAIFPNAYENASPTLLPAEHDWFRVVAQSTGTLDFQVYFQQQLGFLPGKGELQIDAYDASGNLISDFGSNVSTSDQRRRIPAVAGETYYLHVYGALNTTINGYSLSVINTAAPKPDSVALLNAPGSNITNTSAPTLAIRLDAANTPSDGLADLSAGGGGAGQPPDGQPILIPFWSGAAATAPNAPANNGSFRIAVYDETSPQSSTLLGYGSAVAPGVFKFQPSAPLADGQHNLIAKVEFDSPSAVAAQDVGPGTSLSLLILSHAPGVSFGSSGAPSGGLDAASDTGVPGQPATLSDLVTSVSTPTFYGTAAAGAIVKLYADLDNNGVVDSSDVLIGQTVALASDSTNPSSPVPWKLTSNVNLNNAALGFPLDGARTILVTATDAAGNVSAPQSLTIFLDTQGPRVSNVNITGSPTFKLFADKSTVAAPTPLAGSLDITFNDLPSRVGPAFVYPAVNPTLATTLGNYRLVGESTGPVTMTSITFADSSTSGSPGVSVATLHFSKPLADDRYTLTVSDHITDNAGNALDGEFGGVFPSGDGSPGGSFAASFTVNSRPHLGTVNAGSEAIDLNGNLVFDPQNPDAKNRDTTFTFGFPTDQIFAGKFADSHGVVNGFDKFAAYGFAGGSSRWLFDLSGDGKFDPSTGDRSVAEPLPIQGTPVAANFDGHPADGAQVGLFDGNGTWWLDVLNHHTIDQADVAARGKLSGNMRGQPIVGDFDGSGKVDLATYNNGVLYFDLASKDPGGKLTGNWNASLAVAPLLPNTVNLASDQIKVVATDMDQDGITDIGFYITSEGETPSNPSWYWLISNDLAHANRVTGSVNTLNHPFDPAPLGSDLFAQFGSAGAAPIVGLFDPPPDGGGATSPVPVVSGTAAWIEKEYINVLGRQPAAGELNYWVAQVDSGESSAAIAQAFMESDERLAAVIDQLYQQYLGRAADPGGTQYWSSVWRRDGGPEEVQAGIIGSSEYYKTAQSLYPNLAPADAWVTALYHNILGRDVDRQGLAYWVDYIQTHSKQSVVVAFVTSDEHRLELIDNWFVGYLGRSPDSAGAEYWLGQLKAGVGQDAIQIGILSSNEFMHP